MIQAITQVFHSRGHWTRWEAAAPNLEAFRRTYDCRLLTLSFAMMMQITMRGVDSTYDLDRALRTITARVNALD